MHIEASSSKRGRRVLDAPINVVPYIDMLMTIMTFLMITATWTQVKAIESQSSTGGTCTDCTKTERASVTLTAAGIHVGAQHFAAADVAGAVGALVATKKTDLELHVDDGIPFDRVVAVMDAAKAAGFKSQSLASQ